MEEKGFPVVVILTHYCYITIIIIMISIIIISIIITIIFMGYYLNDTLLYHLKPFTNLCPNTLQWKKRLTEAFIPDKFRCL